MQAKPPPACHANLVAEWGGVAAREAKSERRTERVWVLDGVGRWEGGDRRVHYVHRSATMNLPPNHIPTLILMRLCLYASVSLRTQHEFINVCVLLYMSA